MFTWNTLGIAAFAIGWILAVAKLMTALTRGSSSLQAAPTTNSGAEPGASPAPTDD